MQHASTTNRIVRGLVQANLEMLERQGRLEGLRGRILHVLGVFGAQYLNDLRFLLDGPTMEEVYAVVFDLEDQGRIEAVGSAARHHGNDEPCARYALKSPPEDEEQEAFAAG
jgi:hypothetical protein